MLVGMHWPLGTARPPGHLKSTLDLLLPLCSRHRSWLALFVLMLMPPSQLSHLCCRIRMVHMKVRCCPMHHLMTMSGLALCLTHPALCPSGCSTCPLRPQLLFAKFVQFSVLSGPHLSSSARSLFTFPLAEHFIGRPVRAAAVTMCCWVRYIMILA